MTDTTLWSGWRTALSAAGCPHQSSGSIPL